MLAGVAIDFDTGIIAIVELYLADEGVNQRHVEGDVVRIAFLEFLEEEFHRIEGQNRANHLLSRELRFEVGVFGVSGGAKREQYASVLSGRFGDPCPLGVSPQKTRL